jgi:hypothetical protein
LEAEGVIEISAVEFALAVKDHLVCAWGCGLALGIGELEEKLDGLGWKHTL